MVVVLSIGMVLVAVAVFALIKLGEKPDDRGPGTGATAPFMGPGPNGDWAPEKRPLVASGSERRRDAQAQLVCPHCQTKGMVTSMSVKRRRRLSVTRVMGAAVTLGASLPVAGTSKKNVVTQMTCSNCQTTWDVA